MQLSIDRGAAIGRSRRRSEWLVPSVLTTIVRYVDALIVALSGGALLIVRSGGGADTPFVLYSVVLAVVLTLSVFPLAGLYNFKLLATVYGQARRLIIVWPAILALVLTLGVLTRTLDDASRTWSAMWLVTGFFGLLSFRVALRYAIALCLKGGHLAHNVVVIGAGHHGQRFVEHVRRADPGVRLVGLFDDRNDRVPSYVAGFPVLGNVDDVVPFVRDNQIDQVVIALPWNAESRMLKWIGRLRNLPVDILLCPDRISYHLPYNGVSHMGGVPLLNVVEKPFHGWKAIAKGLEDRLLAGVILLGISPLMLVIAAAIRLTSPGPALFRQKRFGFDNDVIEIYKFRSMYIERCDDKEGKLLTQVEKDDPRVTPLGRILRRTSLDELPQFINVLKGEMSIVGPRPHAVAHNEHYASQIDKYLARHRVKPGITGWAQVNGLRGETETIDKMQRRVQFDLFYIENWSLAMDLKIILRTLRVGFSGSNAH